MPEPGDIDGLSRALLEVSMDEERRRRMATAAAAVAPASPGGTPPSRHSSRSCAITACGSRLGWEPDGIGELSTHPDRSRGRTAACSVLRHVGYQV